MDTPYTQCYVSNTSERLAKCKPLNAVRYSDDMSKDERHLTGCFFRSTNEKRITAKSKHMVK